MYNSFLPLTPSFINKKRQIAICKSTQKCSQKCGTELRKWSYKRVPRDLNPDFMHGNIFILAVLYSKTLLSALLNAITQNGVYVFTNCS